MTAPDIEASGRILPAVIDKFNLSMLTCMYHLAILMMQMIHREMYFLIWSGSMLKEYASARWASCLACIGVLFVAADGPVADAADLTVTQTQAHSITASRSRVIWGQPVILTANLHKSEVRGSDVGFYVGCSPGERYLGLGQFVNDGVQINIHANQLSLGSNTIGVEYYTKDGDFTYFCTENVVTVLPVTQ
ncbi:hypothetical protein [Brucella endophytica]|uniref:hypothetical protein n=1 Tax=Brucella endophytica TaxID=1963359 RepID=UPI00166C1132|nr:hypothetical protein [Brucella endophytica]